MGQSALIATVAITITMMLYLYSTQQTSRDTQETQNEAYADKAARNLANHGKKLALASWLESSGASNVAPFSSTTKDGGTIEITSYDLTSNILDVTVRGIYDGAVHDIRSRYQWNSMGLNPFQIKAADLNFDISKNATLDIASITLDDQSLAELDEVLIQDLGLAEDLGEIGLGMDGIQNDISTSLANSGNGNIGLDMIDSAQRVQLEQENGMYFPDQVEQALNTYINANPGIETTSSNSRIPASFGMDTGNEVLRITDDLTVTNLEGKGVLIVEGSLNVPAGATLNWDGLILVKPPASNMNPQINLSGTVTLNGGMIALHDAMPNSGHMDVTAFRDMGGIWASATGPDRTRNQRWNIFSYRHRHDFTSRYGNSITIYSSNSKERKHEREIKFEETLRKISGSSELFLEILNPQAHGRGLLTLELANQGRVNNPVAAGFPESTTSPGNQYRTQTFTKDELKYLHLDITRLSSLKKMWDTKEKYPGCHHTSGPHCVGHSYSRYGSLAIRLYKMNGSAEQMVYSVSMYWHRRTDEIDKFEDSMEDLVDDIKSPNYGLDITMGADVAFTGDPNALSMLNAGGAPLGYNHLGTWHSHWSQDHPDNPLK